MIFSMRSKDLEKHAKNLSDLYFKTDGVFSSMFLTYMIIPIKLNLNRRYHFIFMCNITRIYNLTLH